MANITEVSQWENVIRQLENGEAATGGADGLANIQAKQLANRTKWLKENLAPMANAVFSGTMKHGANDLAGSAIVAKSLGGNGYIKYASGLIIQWGTAWTISNDGKINYPIAFPNKMDSISIIFTNTAHSNTLPALQVDSGDDKTYCIIKNQTENIMVRWLAIGH